MSPHQANKDKQLFERFSIEWWRMKTFGTLYPKDGPGSIAPVVEHKPNDNDKD